MDTTTTRVRAAAHWLMPWVAVRPYTGKMPLDIIYLLLIGALHQTVLPSMVGGVMLVDLMTPWLVTTFVAAPLPRATVLGLLGALILETHSAAPAGLYICAYWVIAVVLRLTRTTLSWRHGFPWMVTFFVTEIWVISFETFVVAVSEGGFHFGFGYALAQIVRLLASTAFGMLLCQGIMAQGLNEDVT